MLNILCDDRFEQSESNPRAFHKFDDEKVEIVVFVRVGDILAHAQATLERFVAELGEKFKVEVDGGYIQHREDEQDTSFFGGVNPLFRWMSHKLRRRRKMC